MIATVENGAGPVIEPAPIEKLKQTVSASRLNCRLQCRLKFFFRYVLQIAKPKTAALHYGSVVHQPPRSTQKAYQGIRQIEGDLQLPRLSRLWNHSRNFYRARRQLEDEKHRIVNQAADRPQLDSDRVQKKLEPPHVGCYDEA